MTKRFQVKRVNTDGLTKEITNAGIAVKTMRKAILLRARMKATLPFGSSDWFTIEKVDF